jgi:hypothetical protein
VVRKTVVESEIWLAVELAAREVALGTPVDNGTPVERETRRDLWRIGLKQKNWRLGMVENTVEEAHIGVVSCALGTALMAFGQLRAHKERRYRALRGDICLNSEINDMTYMVHAQRQRSQK